MNQTLTEEFSQYMLLAKELDDLLAKYPDEAEYFINECQTDVSDVKAQKALIMRINDQIEFNYAYIPINEQIPFQIENLIESIYGPVDYSWNKNRGSLIVDSRESGEHEYENCFTFEDCLAALNREIAAYQKDHQNLNKNEEESE